MNSIKKLFQIPQPPLPLNGWRFWLPWSVCFMANAFALAWFGSKSFSPWSVFNLGVLIWLASALWRHEIFARPVSKMILAITWASHILNLFLLSMLYVLIFCPLGLLLRRKKKSPLQYTMDQKLQSYRIQSEALDPQHFERPF